MLFGDTLHIGNRAKVDTAIVRNHKSQSESESLSGWLDGKEEVVANDSTEVGGHREVVDVEWSERPDTLRVPSYVEGKSYGEVVLPQYYKESFFSRNVFFHPELPGGNRGVVGDPIPYTVASDNLITSLLLACFILGLTAFSKSKRFILRQAKKFFYVAKGNTTSVSETSEELRFQIFLIFQTCLLFAIVFFFYTRTCEGDTFVIENYQVIGIYSAAFAGYFLFKALCYQLVGWVFFDGKKNEQWMKSFLFLSAIEGVALFPIVMVESYFNMPLQTTLVFVACLVILFKLLTLYKSYLIFFVRKSAFLQIILYFCTLELMPLLSFWGVLVMINDFLKVNF